jgi:hypothetical protein
MNENYRFLSKEVVEISLVNTVKRLLKNSPPDKRLDILHEITKDFCTDCGSDDVPCCCTWDE